MRFDFNDNKLTNVMCETHDPDQTGSILYLITQQFFGDIRSHEVDRKGRGFSSLFLVIVVS